MSNEVRVKLQIASKNCNFIKSLRASLSPDNLVLPSNMYLNEVFEAHSTGECIYLINLTVKDDILHSLRRARSTMEEILAIIKTLQKSLCAVKETCLENL
ncbi:MAG: hypothetical protein QXM43_04195 [Desulfurococcaceae archaeon]